MPRDGLTFGCLAETLLMGFDLRKPKIYKDFGLSNAEGISSYLINMVLFDTGVVPLGVYDKKGVPGPDSAFFWYGFWPDDIKIVHDLCNELGTGASISVFEPCWMKNVVAMAHKGTLPRGSKLNIYFADYGWAGMAPQEYRRTVAAH